VKDFARLAFTIWLALSILVGTTLALLTLASGPSGQLDDSIIDGNGVCVAAIVCVRWSVLTFACGAALTWAVAALRTRVVAGRPRRHSRKRPAAPSDDRNHHLVER
jgi:hypothetical protein